MMPQENINNLLSKMEAALQALRECETLIKEENRQLTEMQAEKARLAEEIAILKKAAENLQRDSAASKSILNPETDIKEVFTTTLPAQTVITEKHNVETLADKFQSQPSLNDKITAKPETLSTNSPISDISKAISINDRLLFIKELFGNSEVFTQTVKHLNSLQNFDDAQTYLSTTFPHWDNSIPSIQLFLSITRRRYL